METSKLFLWIITVLSVILTGFSIYQMIILETCEPLSYLIPAIFAELAAATASYYVKAKNENKIKIMMSAVKEITDDTDTLNDEKVRVIESVLNNLTS